MGDGVVANVVYSVTAEACDWTFPHLGRSGRRKLLPKASKAYDP